MEKASVITNTLMSAITGFTKLIGGVVLLHLSVKVIGNDNLVFLGQFNSVFMLCSILAGAGVYTGTVALHERKKGFLSFRDIGLLALLLVLVSIIVFVALYSFAILNKYNGSNNTFIIALVLLCFFPISEFLLAIINVTQKDKYTYYARSLSVIFSLFFGWVLINYVNGGACLINSLYGMSLFFSCLFIFIILNCSKKKILPSAVTDKLTNKDYAPYVKVAVVSIAFMPLSKLITRDELINVVSKEQASLFQSFLTMSDAYSVIYVLFLTSFYIKFASKEADKNILSIFHKTIALLALPLFIAFILAYFLWPTALKLIFDLEINKLYSFLHYFILGEVFRYGSLLISYNFIVRGQSSVALTFEVLQSVLFYFFITQGAAAFMLEGAILGYMLSYSLLFMALYFYIFNSYKKNKSMGPSIRC